MYIKVIDTTNGFKSMYKTRTSINKLEAFLKKFNFLNIDDLFIFPSQYEKKIIINIEDKTQFNNFNIKIVLSGLTNKTYKQALNITLDTFYKGAWVDPQASLIFLLKIVIKAPSLKI